MIPTESDIPMHGWKPYSDMHRERIRAHNKHDADGGSMERVGWYDPAWLPVIAEEFGEVAAELTYDKVSKDPTKLRKELVQLGAMVAAWIDAIDAQDAENRS